MQTQIDGLLSCFHPKASAKTAKPQLLCGAAAQPALWTGENYHFGDDEHSDIEEGLTQDDLMEVLTLYLF